VESAKGERYTDVSGKLFKGVDAVEYAMGKGLPARTGFGAIRHAETGQGSGAFFILFLKDRNFSYYGDEVCQFRGLGAERWGGQLDVKAKSAMRNGGRIVSAVEGTVKYIDGRLSEVLRKEAMPAQKPKPKKRVDDQIFENFRQRPHENKVPSGIHRPNRVEQRPSSGGTGGVNLVYVLGYGGSGTLGALAFLGHRGRRKVKTQAEELLQHRKDESKEMVDRLFAVMDRAAVIVGPIGEIKTRGYQGETLRLSKLALEKVDEAFVLSSNVKKVVEEAEELITPGNPLSKGRNFPRRFWMRRRGRRFGWIRCLLF